MSNEYETYIGLDVGEKRIGVARVVSGVGIAQPLVAVPADSEQVFELIRTLLVEHTAVGVVVGLPRGLDGQETTQTQYCRAFAASLLREVSVPVYLIDEAGSSREADERIRRGMQGSRDSIAAAVILETFIVQKDRASYEVRV